MLSKDELLERVIQNLPTPRAVSRLDTQSEPDAIRFDWGGSRFRVTRELMVEEVDGGVLRTTHETRRLERMFRRVKGAR